MAQWSGGCACGAIRFACESEPVAMIKCHCRDCQRASGGAYAAIALFPKVKASLTGEPRYHRVIGSSGQPVHRGFCEACGSPLSILLDAKSDIIGFQAASLDDPAQFKAGIEFYTESAWPWDLMDTATPKKPRGSRG